MPCAPTLAPVTPEAADAALFDGGLALEAALRAAVIAGPLPPGALEAAERLLQDIAGIEERRGDESDAAHPGDPLLRRLEAKLDLALQLFAHALPHLGGPPPQRARIGVRGLRLKGDAGIADAAVLRWQPAEALPLCLHLPVRRHHAEGAHDWWALEPLPQGLEDALSRHLFRLHRRELAAQRRR